MSTTDRTPGQPEEGSYRADGLTHRAINAVSNLSRRQIIGAAVVSALAITANSTVYRVDATQNAVITTFGKISRVDGAGLNFKIPFVQSATFYQVDLQSLEIIQKRPPCNSQKTGDDSDIGNTTYTKDQQFLYASTTAQINLPAGEGLKVIHSNYQNYKAVLTNYLNQAMKEVLGGYNTTEIPSVRTKIAKGIESAFQAQIEAKGIPVTVTAGVQFGNFDFSCQYEAQVENAAETKTKLTRIETELSIQRVEKDKTVVDAEAQKQRATLEGEGDAAKILAKATAEARGITLMQAALANSPYVIDYVKANRWNGALPVNMYGSAPIPFLDVTPHPPRLPQTPPIAPAPAPAPAQ